MRIGRNEPCPCGSGKKHKRCCLDSPIAERFTAADRQSAFIKLERIVDLLEDEESDAYADFWGERDDEADELDDDQMRMSEDAFDLWFCCDRPLADGTLVVDRLLAADTSVTAAERRFLSLLRETCMRLYEVEDCRPGVSLSLRDLLAGTRVTVNERLGSRTLGRADLLAARIIPVGVSGRPEIEAGLLPLSQLQRPSIVAQLEQHLAEFRKENPSSGETALFKEMPPFFHDAWVTALLHPVIPQLQNTDGEALVITRVHFRAAEPDRLAAVFDVGEGLQREGREGAWIWTGMNRKNERTILGTISLDEKGVALETNSVARGERGRALVERIAGHLVTYQSTTSEDPRASIRESLRSGREHVRPEPPTALPAGIAEDLTLDHLGRHYRAWLDESIPALDGRTPREAARDAALVSRLSELIRQLEGMYQMALRRNEPAYVS